MKERSVNGVRTPLAEATEHHKFLPFLHPYNPNQALPLTYKTQKALSPSPPNSHQITHKTTL